MDHLNHMITALPGWNQTVSCVFQCDALRETQYLPCSVPAKLQDLMGMLKKQQTDSDYTTFHKVNQIFSSEPSAAAWKWSKRLNGPRLDLKS